MGTGWLPIMSLMTIRFVLVSIISVPENLRMIFFVASTVSNDIGVDEKRTISSAPDRYRATMSFSRSMIW